MAPERTSDYTKVSRIRNVSVAEHRSSLPLYPNLQEAFIRPHTTSSTQPIAIPPRKMSRRSFEMPRSPEYRRASSSLHSSSPEISIDELDKRAFIKLLTDYQNGEKERPYVLRVLQKNMSQVSEFMKEDGADFIASLGEKKVDCILGLLAEDAKNFPHSAPLRENTLCTAFYREYCLHTFGSILHKYAHDPKIFPKKDPSSITDELKEKLLMLFTQKINKKLAEIETHGLRAIHRSICDYLNNSSITNHKGFVLVTFINRVVSPIFTNSWSRLVTSTNSSDQKMAAIYKAFGIYLHHSANAYLSGASLSPRIVTALTELANVIY
jgi:hypothetical protein